MQSQACCTVPPVISKGYEAKGTYTTIDGMKTYTTGPKDAKKALLVVYDIFGFKDQTLQGADILATSDNENQYQVFMPDFFEGKPVDISDYPPDTVCLIFYIENSATNNHNRRRRANVSVNSSRLPAHHPRPSAVFPRLSRRSRVRTRILHPLALSVSAGVARL
jgi:hypothetical protein